MRYFLNYANIDSLENTANDHLQKTILKVTPQLKSIPAYPDRRVKIAISDCLYLLKHTLFGVINIDKYFFRNAIFNHIPVFLKEW